MHIPSLIGSGIPCPVTSAVAGVGIVVAAYTSCQSHRKPSIFKFTMISSLIYWGQMFDFPFHGIVPGHLVGGVLAVALLGIPFGVLSMALVVSSQCLFMGDGEISALGANIIQMAFIAAGFGGLIKAYLLKHNIHKFGKYMILALSTWGSVVSASVFCALTLFWDHSLLLAEGIGNIVRAHLLIGVGEAFVTIGTVFVFSVVMRFMASEYKQAVLLFSL